MKGLLERLESRADSVNPVHPKDPILAEWFGGAGTASGIAVTADTAKKVSAFNAGARYIAETIAYLPFPVYRRLGDNGRERDTLLPLSKLLNETPNPWQTPFEFREYQLLSLIYRGNAYAEIIFEPKMMLIPLDPDRVRPFQAPNRQRAFEFQGVDGRTRIILQEEMYFVAGLGFDGIKGKSVLEYAQEALGISVVSERYGARLFANDSRPGGYLEHPKTLSKDAQKRLVEAWEERHQGATNAHRIAVLEEGMKFNQVGITPEEAQFLGLRQFERIDIAAFLRIPPHKIGELGRATWGNVEQMSIEAVTDCLMPWITRLEQATDRDLFTEATRRTHFAEILVDGLLRGDVTARWNAYRTAWNMGAMNLDQIRQLENMNPIANGGGKEYWIPLNMVPLSQALKEPVPLKMPALTEPAPQRALKPGEQRSVKGRQRLQRAYEPLWKDAAIRILRREVAAIEKASKKYLGQRNEGEFDLWLEQFYDEHRAYVVRTVKPVAMSYSEAISAESLGEIGSDITPDIDNFTAAYIATFASRYVGSSIGQIRAIHRESGPQDIVGALIQRTSEWLEYRPGQVAMNEVVQQNNAVSREVFRQAGVTKLRWVTVAGNCPLCENLDGMIVGIEQDFAGKGDLIEAEGKAPIHVERQVGNPPIHQGCQCQIVAA